MKILYEPAKLPKRATEFAAGYDLYTPCPVLLEPGKHVEIPLGFAAWFTPGWAAMIFDRSGFGVKGVIRRAGLIDGDYPGEWILCLSNIGNQTITCEPGDRVAQVCFTRCASEPAIWSHDLPKNKRTGGFGSTGK